MIDYAVRRHDWYADQVHKLMQIGLALLASVPLSVHYLQN